MNPKHSIKGKKPVQELLPTENEPKCTSENNPQAPGINCLAYNSEGFINNDQLPVLFDTVLLDRIKNANNAASETPGSPLTDLAQPMPSAWKYIHWINIDNPDLTTLDKVCSLYGIHPVIAEDVLTPLPRPRIQEFTAQMYLTLQLPIFRHGDLWRDRLCLILGQGFVVSFFNQNSAVLKAVRERIQNDQGRIRQMGADYLLISLLDEAIERSFPVIELLESGVEDLETEIIQQPSHEKLENILESKRTITSLRHYIWPAAEAILSLSRSRSLLLTPQTRIFLRDVAEHGMHLSDLVNTLRDMNAGLLDIYHSSSSASLNKVMKMLTMISTIFIPLTFIAGVEGMNIQGMPELSWPFTYPMLMGLMIAIAAGMLYFFKRKKWF